MKKLFVLLLTAAMSIPVCANAEIPDEIMAMMEATGEIGTDLAAAEEENIETSPAEVLDTTEYAIGEAFGTDRVECVITELKWLTSEDFKKYSRKNGESLLLVPELVFPDHKVNGIIGIAESKVSDNSFLCVTYSLQNVGKEVVDCDAGTNEFGFTSLLPYGTIAVIYDDGYTFGVEGSGFTSTLSVLGDAVTEVMMINLPNQVYENDDKPLKLKVTLPASNGETQAFMVDVDNLEKPEPSDYQEEAYLEAVSLMDSKKYSSATEILMELQGYKDADTRLLECCVKGWEGFDYLKEHKDEFMVISDEELRSELVSASWVRTDGETWQFFEDGTLDTGRIRPADGAKVIMDWSVQGDTLVLGAPIETSISLRKVYDGALVGFTDEGTVYLSMWKAQ